MEYTLLYDDLSPTKKAAKEMEEKLPDLWTMSAESRKIFHFDIEEYDVVIRTIQLVCEKKGILEPKIVSAETFCSWVAGTDPKKRKQADFSFDDLKEQEDIKNSGLVFVNMITENGSSEKLYNELLLKYIQYCEEKQSKQITGQIKEQMSFYELSQREGSVEESERMDTQVLFVYYGKNCSCPEKLKNQVYKVCYDSLTKDDFRILLQEFHRRNQLKKEEELRKRGLKVQQKENLDFTKLERTLQWYEDYMSGIPEIEVRRLLLGMWNKFQGNIVDYTDTDKIEGYIVEYKNKILLQHGRLELVSVGESSSVCGVEQVEKWIEKHKAVMRLQEDAPTGIMLVGIPGTGKSAIAKMAAREFRLPLVRLDMSRILGGRVGDSEKGMQEMFEDLKFAAPCILWIDEIEKAMSGADGKSGDSGVIQRLFGMLLTFIQENEKPVFTVTTANDISKLPPEFFRNGRFDQTFCVMMPDYKGCCDIMKSKLDFYVKKLGWNRTFSRDETQKILNACVGTKTSPRFLTGADIEAHVKELFWKYEESGKRECPSNFTELVEDMDDIAKTMRVQASVDSPNTMENIAKCYLDMMQDGMRMAGSVESPFVMKNLNLEAVRFYEYDEEEAKTGKGLPSCISKKYDEHEERKESNEPAMWYDVIFYDELVNAMGEVIIFDKEKTLEGTRTEYLKLMRYRNKRKSGR